MNTQLTENYFAYDQIVFPVLHFILALFHCSSCLLDFHSDVQMLL